MLELFDSDEEGPGEVVHLGLPGAEVREDSESG